MSRRCHPAAKLWTTRTSSNNIGITVKSGGVDVISSPSDLVGVWRRRREKEADILLASFDSKDKLFLMIDPPAAAWREYDITSSRTHPFLFC